MKPSNENEILFNFLKLGLSTRQMDAITGYKHTNGWQSWEILKKYGLKNEDKGILFVYSNQQAKSIISSVLSDGSLNLKFKKILPTPIKKYKEIKIIAGSEDKLYSAISGETRNIVRDFFASKKRQIGICQFQGCHYKGELDTVHLAEDRPSIFKRCAIGFRKRKPNRLFEYNLFGIMKCFLEQHAKRNAVCFLCKKHHVQLHKIENEPNKFASFKKRIK